MRKIWRPHEMPETVKNLADELNLQKSILKESPSIDAYKNSLQTLFKLHQQLNENDMLPNGHAFTVNQKGVIRVFENDPASELKRSKRRSETLLNLATRNALRDMPSEDRKALLKNADSKLINFDKFLRKKREKELKDKK